MRRILMLLSAAALLAGCRNPDADDPVAADRFSFAVTGSQPLPAGFRPQLSVEGGTGQFTLRGAVAVPCGKVLTGTPSRYRRTGAYTVTLTTRMGTDPCVGASDLAQAFEATFQVAPGTHQTLVYYYNTVVGDTAMFVTVH